MEERRDRETERQATAQLFPPVPPSSVPSIPHLLRILSAARARCDKRMSLKASRPNLPAIFPA